VCSLKNRSFWFDWISRQQFAQWSTICATQYHEHFRENANRNFPGRIRTDIDPDGGANLGQGSAGETARGEFVEHGAHFFSAADHPDITDASGFQSCRKCFTVDVIVAADEDKRVPFGPPVFPD